MNAEANRRARVVVVDDSRFMRELASEALGDAVRVECCQSAEAALHALDREPADLVLSDLEMEGMSGLELLDRVRRTHPGTEFVVLTAHASVQSAIQALRLGATDYLEKPIQPEQLSLVVERILAHRRLVAENMRLRGALRAVESCRTLVHCLEAGEVYAVALDLLLGGLGRDRGVAVFRRSPLPGSNGVAFRGFDEGVAQFLRRSLTGEKPLDLDGMRGVHVARTEELEQVLAEAGASGGSALVVPMRGADREIGAAWIFEDGHPFTTSDLEQSSLIAAHADLALSNAERYLRAKERAFVDDVTEVYNARYLLQATENEIQRAERSGRELTVLFLDLDRFKLVNDEHGHLVGSDVLRKLSRVLTECVRQVDTLARYGGDEFTILLVDTDHEAALQVAERIRRIVGETVFEGGPGVPIRLSISIGVATYPRHSLDRDGLLDLADKAMYRAKSMGRNCVCSATDLD